MENRTPHCTLTKIKTLVRDGRVKSTFSALSGGAALGLDFAGMIDIIVALTPTSFYKSMATHQDHRIWQDVYRSSTVAGDVYIKLTVVDDVLIVSFKEL